MLQPTALIASTASRHLEEPSGAPPWRLPGPGQLEGRLRPVTKLVSLPSRDPNVDVSSLSPQNG